MAGLQWVRMDTQLPMNPKILELVSENKWRAAAVFQFSLEYCGAHSTDGFIKRVALKAIHASPKVAAELVEVGLWAVDPAGWYIPDFAEYQQLSGKTADVRAAQKAGATKGNCRRWHGDDCECWKQAFTP